MFIIILSCISLISLTTVIHYEVLRLLNAKLPAVSIPNRSKLMLVIFGSFLGHALEIGVYGISFFLLAKYVDVGTLTGPGGFSMENCLYFSTETFTSLGFGDISPVGRIRLLAGIEALNGLLLIGWSASFTYISMERFWTIKGHGRVA